jgi:plasmid maintenance system killer protein
MDIDELAVPPGNHWEKLTGDREGHTTDRFVEFY